MRRLPLRSPLRMRGKGPDDRAHPLVPGITPACAGKRKPHLHKKGCTWDHPRVCGEKFSSMWRRYMVSGSPPRMRGKASALDVLPLPCGITPAYAGKSSEDTRRSGTNGDHPRVCGEKSFENGVKGYFEGSPPRMRGKAPARIAEMMLSRITPACAGKSLPAVLKCPPTRDHPRVCGEKPLQSSVNCTMEGLPPRMRGKVISSLQCDFLSGITPACAGKSCST